MSTETPISDSNNTSTNDAVAVDTTAASATGDQTTQSTRLFIGNLPFRANYSHIKELFADFPLLAIKMPKMKGENKDGQTRLYKRGFAFVELRTPEEADQAIAKLSGTTLQDRQLEIKKALPTAKRSSRSRANKENGAAKTETANGAEAKTATGEPAKSKKRAARQPKKVGAPSTDTVFVANLPVDTTEDKVKQFFSALNPVEIRIVSKKEHVIKRKNIVKPARTLAFVKFADEQTRQKAIDEYAGKELDGVALEIKVAVEPPVQENKETNGDDAAEPQAATSEPVASA